MIWNFTLPLVGYAKFTLKAKMKRSAQNMSISETSDSLRIPMKKKKKIKCQSATTSCDHFMQSYFEIKVEHHIFCLLHMSMSL